MGFISMNNEKRLNKLISHMDNTISKWKPTLINTHSANVIRETLKQSLGLLETNIFKVHGIDETNYDFLYREVLFMNKLQDCQNDCTVFEGIVEKILTNLKSVASNYTELKEIDIKSLSHEQLVNLCNSPQTDSLGSAIKGKKGNYSVARKKFRNDLTKPQRCMNIRVW